MARTTASLTPNRDCLELAAILGPDWDGRLTRRLRRPVARHIDGCDVCCQRRKKAGAFALAAVVPAEAPPAAVPAAAPPAKGGHLPADVGPLGTLSTPPARSSASLEHVYPLGPSPSRPKGFPLGPRPERVARGRALALAGAGTLGVIAAGALVAAVLVSQRGQGPLGELEAVGTALESGAGISRDPSAVSTGAGATNGSDAPSTTDGVAGVDEGGTTATRTDSPTGSAPPSLSPTTTTPAPASGPGPKSPAPPSGGAKGGGGSAGGSGAGGGSFEGGSGPGPAGPGPAVPGPATPVLPPAPPAPPAPPPAPPAEPAMVSPGTLDLGSVWVGESVERAVKVKFGNSPGTLAVTIAPPPSGSTDGSPFTVADTNCPAAPAAGDTCAVRVRFSPSSGGTVTGTLRFSLSNGTTTDIALSGTGLQLL